MNIANNNAIANRRLYWFLLIGILPLGIIFILFSHNPDSPAFYGITVIAHDIPAFTSSNNPLMSKVMDVYCKTSPLLAILMFATSIKHKREIKITNRSKLIKSAAGSILFSIILLYIFLFHNFELTTMGRPIKNMATNDFSLSIIYVFLYFLIFMLTYALLLMPVIIKKAIQENR